MFFVVSSRVGQCSHVVCPVADENVFIAHKMQADWPELNPNFPTAQSVQFELPAFAYVPGPHIRHALRPELEKYPPVHATQEVAPGFGP